MTWPCHHRPTRTPTATQHLPSAHAKSTPLRNNQYTVYLSRCHCLGLPRACIKQRFLRPHRQATTPLEHIMVKPRMCKSEGSKSTDFPLSSLQRATSFAGSQRSHSGPGGSLSNTASQKTPEFRQTNGSHYLSCITVNDRPLLSPREVLPVEIFHAKLYRSDCYHDGALLQSRPGLARETRAAETCHPQHHSETEHTTQTPTHTPTRLHQLQPV